MINVELFSCAGGMAEGFRRSGIEFDVAVDFEPDHCDSYERNIGHRPIAMDARDLLRMVQLGWRVEVDLLVADPPCTPWSRAGKRLGTADERDMLEVTCELIALLRPRRYLVGNVPGLDDATNLPIVQRLIGGLAAHGYCTADFARLDAADYGVPQHRIRPFWFGHLQGPCIRWTASTHCDPAELTTLAIPGIAPLRPWVTCRDALGHLSGEQLGRSVKMPKRAQNGEQAGSVADRPSRVVGTSNLSDGNVLSYTRNHPPSFVDEPAMAVRAGSGGGATRAVQLRSRHDAPMHTSDVDRPARAVTTQCRAAGHATTLVLNERHAPVDPDSPAPTIAAKMRAQGGQVLGVKRKRPASTQGPQSTRTISPDRPATTVQAREDRVGSGSPVLDWPWPRPATTVTARPGLAPPGHHGEDFVTARPGLAPPGHHGEDFAIMSLPDAVLLSERAAAILQGFPESWVFSGETKKARWAQIGQAMPPALAEAVARAIVEQDSTARRDQAELALEAG